MSEWIDVSDRLPEDAAEVLIKYESGEKSIGAFSEETYDGRTEKVWHSYDHGIAEIQWLPVDYVSAWMPIPD